MPRGYLKHVPGESRKRSRGGGSHRNVRNQNKRKLRNKAQGHRTISMSKQCELRKGLDSFNDIEVLNPFFLQEDGTEPGERVLVDVGAPRRQIQDCPVCFHSRPVVPLMQRCFWHDAACLDCLRQMYVIEAQKSARNYPLKCFHPQCRLPIRETQLLKYSLIRSKAEMTRHFQLSELAKGRNVLTNTVHCPFCDHPRAYKQKEPNKQVNNRIFSCRECKQNFMVSPFEELVRAMENAEGEAADWAQCPECRMLISKEYGGEDDTMCFCGANFSWRQAQRQSGFRYPIGRPSGDLDPFDVLYLYW